MSIGTVLSAYRHANTHTHAHTTHARTHTNTHMHTLTHRHPHNTSILTIQNLIYTQLGTGTKQRLETNEDSSTVRKKWQVSLQQPSSNYQGAGFVFLLFFLFFFSFM